MNSLLGKILCGAVVCIISACGGTLVGASYDVELPEIPPSWIEVFGEPSWRIEWLNRDGNLETLETDSMKHIRIHVLQEWTSPVTAYPYWEGVSPKTLKSAGAIFPFDKKDGAIVLSWIGGVSAEFYLNLARVSERSSKYQPQYFDWVRFREILEDAKDDLWLVDWETVCEKTVAGGFNKKYVNVPERETLSLPAPADGPWISASPFAAPLTSDILEIKVSSAVDTYFSKEGKLLVTKGLWMWIPGR
ncbi:MAG: hypothetical protein LBG05_08745 [Treponema sp.]|jgi:hypothetical protein|nr:hypothetical protein [Treponema sp.]